MSDDSVDVDAEVPIGRGVGMGIVPGFGDRRPGEFGLVGFANAPSGSRAVRAAVGTDKFLAFVRSVSGPEERCRLSARNKNKHSRFQL